MNTPSKDLIVCADDFAASEAVSRGIADLALSGRISATSVMALSPRWRHDAAMLKGVRGQLDVGLHLDWTSEFALQAGHGGTLPTVMLKAMLGRLSERDAVPVIERQLDAFEAHWQAAPDHVDGHQHVQQFAGIREALVEVLARRYSLSKPYLRVSRMAAGEAGLKGRVITMMGANAIETIAECRGFIGSGSLFGVYDFTQRQRTYAQWMAHWLASISPNAILMCHPARAVEAGDPIGPARAWEYDYLAGSEYSDALARAGVRLVRGQGHLKSRRDQHPQ